ncbi:MAG: phosphoribosyltransferase family protein [Candidatus Latescibacter sp.]|nr:phosphoribosyltransferase family protein [Candidatus Latescibacter sp.]
MGKVHIISKYRRLFLNRVEAGSLLGQELKRLNLEKPIVMGIPRGGIIIAREASLILGCDMDIVLSRKLGAPGNPELAIGAIAEDGSVFLNEMISSRIGVYDSYIEQEKARQLSVISARSARYRSILPKADLHERPVIITDDGIATGATMQAALRVARRENPSYLIAAAPVGAEDSVSSLAGDADEVICLNTPPFFAGVGQFYVEFTQVDDQTVEEIMREEAEKRAAG